MKNRAINIIIAILLVCTMIFAAGSLLACSAPSTGDDPNSDGSDGANSEDPNAPTIEASGEIINFSSSDFEDSVKEQLGFDSDESVDITEGHCNALTELKLKGSFREGLLDLQYCPNLVSLELTSISGIYGRSVIDLTSIAQLKKLEKLTLLSGDLEDFTALENHPSLRELVIDNVRIKTEKGINKIPSLTHLTIDSCDATRIVEIPKLEWLELSDIGLVKNYEILGNLKNLKGFRLAIDQDLFDDYDYSFINEFTQLESLYILSNVYVDIAVDRMPNLKSLYCRMFMSSDGNSYGDELLNKLNASGALENLEYLCLLEYHQYSSNYLSDAGFATLVQAKNLRELEIEIFESVSTLDGIDKLSNLKKLILSLGRRDFEEVSPLDASALSNMPYLEELTISLPAGIDTYDYLKGLTGLKRLELLGIAGDFSFSALTNMKALEELAICGTGSFRGQITIIDLNGVEELTSLKRIIENNTEFVSDAPLDNVDVEIERDVYLHSLIR